MRNKIFEISLVVLLLFMFSCGDIMDANLVDDKVDLIAPGDSIITKSTEIKFLWKANDDAVNYRFQLVKPSFEKLEELVIDSITDGCLIKQKLIAGKYSWRVCAMNASGSSEYETRYFEIEKIVVEDE